MDDVITLVKKGIVEKLQDHMNTVDPTGSIKFTREEEENKSMPFLDARFTRKEDGSVKSTVYRKKTHTDQYLNFASHHPRHQKIGVVRTLLNRCEAITSEEGDKKEEEDHLRAALGACGYPPWALKKAAEGKKREKEDKGKNPEKKFKSQVVIPYVEGVSERVDRVLKKYDIATAMRPHTTLRCLLVHPKDKMEAEEQGELVYQIPCKNCPSTYTGETGRLFKTRLEEHKKDVENVPQEQYTRGEKKRSLSVMNKSTITDHTTQENHVIDWEGAKVVDRESHKRRRHVKEAIWIRKADDTMNRDEGIYELTHLFDGVIRS